MESESRPVLSPITVMNYKAAQKETIQSHHKLKTPVSRQKFQSGIVEARDNGQINQVLKAKLE